ncbi:MAG: hypothetical protein NTW50_01660 [Candidatus Berkelbacteria bacterium]|nr:hypothetical protein [Candidatus Berkelbacteria bacterium]
MDFKKPVFVVLAIVALVIAISWNLIGNYIKNKNTANTATNTTTNTAVETTTVTDLTNATAADFTQTISDEYALANQKASAANSQNQLCGIEVVIGSGLTQDSVSTRYIYTTGPSDTNNWIFNVKQTSQSFIRSLIPKEDYLGEMATFSPANWKKSYVEALQIAEQSGGATWRSNNSGSFNGVDMTLKAGTGTNPVVWQINYLSSDVMSTQFQVVINASSGAVVTNSSSSN